MSNNLYYGEIAAKISAHLYQQPELINELELLMGQELEDDGSSVWTICADAARIFDSLEDLSGDHYIDWQRALDHYADELLDHILMGQIPHMVDMVSMASRSIQHAR